MQRPGDRAKKCFVYRSGQQPAGNRSAYPYTPLHHQMLSVLVYPSSFVGQAGKGIYLVCNRGALHARRYKENKLFHGTVTYSIARNADMQLPCLPARKIKQRVVGVQLST